METLKEIIRVGDLCFDIGANLGNKTQEMLDLGSSVLSIEPQENCYFHLKNRFIGNSNINIVNYGCGSSNRKDIMNISSSHTLSTMSDSFIKETTKERFTGTTWDEKKEIELVTLDYLIDIYGVPRFCKIDVEGYELDVLKGLTYPVEFISLEFVPELKNSSFECIDYLLKIGEYVFNYSEGESGIFEFTNWLNSEDLIRYLSEKNDFKNSFGDIYAKKI